MSRPLMISIPFSHFCEKARWGLERAGIDFEEEGHLPIFHVRAVRRIGGARSVPTLRTAEGVLNDSTEILLFADRRAAAERRLYPTEEGPRREVLELEEWFDTRLGPDSRRWVYSFVLPDRSLLAEIAGYGVPGWEMKLLMLGLPLARALMRKGMRIYPKQVARSLATLHETFDKVGERLADGRRFLVGDRLTAADITFASLAAPVLMPPEYPTPMPAIERFPAAIQAEIRWFQEHPAGRFALRLYAEERRRR
ncbi:MAG: glutathione S-transferase [Nannocystis sp.]|nr:glutathione S-transferase [Nannocystis sp.]